MPFSQFLRTTVLICAAAASALAAVTIVAIATGRGSASQAPVAVGWWLASGAIGVWLGRRAQTSSPIASLLASARTGRSLPEVNPAGTLINRLWPLLTITIAAAAFGLAVPQVPAVATGFEIIWALAWRRQSSAVQAIEDRDGARFFIERTSPIAPIKLTRTPGFRSDRRVLDGAESSPAAAPRA